MKVGFIGNLNNYLVPVALEMRRRGLDVRLFVDSVEPLHRPEFRFDPAQFDYGDWVVDVSPLRMRDAVLPTRRHRRLRRLLADLDVLVGIGAGIPLTTLAACPSFAVGGGFDVDMIAHDRPVEYLVGPSWWAPRRLVAAAVARRYVAIMRAGFRQAVGVNYYIPGLVPHGDAALERAGITEARRVPFLLTDTDRIGYDRPAQRAGPLRILNIARLVWKRPFPAGFGVLDDKRNDMLLHGVALHRARSGRPVEICLPRKGLHVRETEKLVEVLGLGDCTTWLDEMGQAAFLDEMRRADVIVDQLGDGAIGMGARDAMALGRPVLAHWKAELFEREYGDFLPALDVADAEGVADALGMMTDDAARLALGVAARAFAERHFSPSRMADAILDAFRRAGVGV